MEDERYGGGGCVEIHERIFQRTLRHSYCNVCNLSALLCRLVSKVRYICIAYCTLR